MGPIIGVLVVVFHPPCLMSFYYFAWSSASSTVNASMVLVSTVGMMCFFLQTLAVMGTLNMDWPADLQWLFALSRLFLFDLDDLPIACLSGGSFNAKFTTSVMVPIVIVVAMVIGGVISFLTKDMSMMSDRKPMRFNEAFSTLGMIFTALYITLAKVVFSYFECPENPSAPATMQKFIEVECGGEAHKEGFPAMVFGVSLYLVGFYSLNLNAVRNAPSKWMDIKFRTQYRYLFMRWRLESYYWGMMLMSRNLLVGVAAMISSVVVTQLSWCIIVIFFFVTATAIRQPWRHPYLNYFDVASAECIAITGFAGLIFVSQQDQMLLFTRLQESAVLRLRVSRLLWVRALLGSGSVGKGQ